MKGKKKFCPSCLIFPPYYVLSCSCSDAESKDKAFKLEETQCGIIEETGLELRRPDLRPSSVTTKLYDFEQDLQTRLQVCEKDNTPSPLLINTQFTHTCAHTQTQIKPRH